VIKEDNLSDSFKFNIGDRVVIKDHWEFADGIVGTIVTPAPFLLANAQEGEWQGHRRTIMGRKSLIHFYFVKFDMPADDGSGDGDYTGAEIEEECLIPLSEYK